jgi:hypothetical protein
MPLQSLSLRYHPPVTRSLQVYSTLMSYVNKLVLVTLCASVFLGSLTRKTGHCAVRTPPPPAYRNFAAALFVPFTSLLSIYLIYIASWRELMINSENLRKSRTSKAALDTLQTESISLL